MADYIKQIKIGTTSYDIKAAADLSGNLIESSYLKLSGGTMTGALYTAGTDIILKTNSTSSNDSGDLVGQYGNGNEKMRIGSNDTYTAASGPNFRIYKSDGTSLFSGTLSLSNHNHDSSYVNVTGDTMSGSLHVAKTANNTAGLAINIQTKSYNFGLHMGTGGTNHGLYDWSTPEGGMIVRGSGNNIGTSFNADTSSASIRNIAYGTGAPNNNGGENGQVYIRYTA